MDDLIPATIGEPPGVVSGRPEKPDIVAVVEQDTRAVLGPAAHAIGGLFVGEKGHFFIDERDAKWTCEVHVGRSLQVVGPHVILFDVEDIPSVGT